MIQEQTNGLPDSASSSLVATREAIAKALARAALDWTHTDCGSDDHDLEHTNWEAYLDDVADLFESGVVREVGDVEAEQREKDAVIAETRFPEPAYSWVVHRTATDIADLIRGGEKNERA